MAGSNNIVTKTVNRTTFEVDKGSYQKTMRAIKNVKKEWEKAGQAVAQPKNSPAKAYDKAAREMRLVNKRLADTRKREDEKATAHAIALAKKEARAKEAIQKQSAARIKQTMTQMTAKNPEAARMRKFYQEQEKAARKAERSAKKSGGTSGPMNIKRINSMQLPSRGALGTGMVGNPNNISSPERIARQNRQMAGSVRLDSKALDKRNAATAAAQRQEANRVARAQDVIAQQRIRLSSKYGDNYHQTLGRGGDGAGIQDLSAKFRAGSLSAGQYRQSIQALERQFRSTQGAAVSFGSVLEDIRGGLVGVGAAYGVFNTGAAILRQGQFFQGLDATMLMVSDSSEEAAQRIQFVRDQSMRLGLDLKEAAQGYVQMSIAANGVLDKNQANALFQSFSEYSTALQVDPVKFQRGITAIQQMMGKGQIMAEELKGQLAEGIPGSLQVFVKATQEAFGDTTIDVTKLMDMMQQGQLKAAKIMPFVAKYYAEAARKGGALDTALNGNRVAMQRLQQTWMNFQDEVFKGGFGEQMTRVFNDLAKILSSNGELATNIGSFFGNLIEGAWDAVTTVHDAFVFLDRVMTYYLGKLGMDGDILKDVFDWAGYVLGIGIFIKSLTMLFGILTKIAGLKGSLGLIRAALGGIDAATGGGAGITTGGSGGAAGPSSPWRKGGKGGMLGRVGSGVLKTGGALLSNNLVTSGVIAGSGYLLSDSGEAKGQALQQTLGNAESKTNLLSQASGGSDMAVMASLLWNSLFGTSAPPTSMDPEKVAQNAITTTNPFPYPLQNPAQEVNGQITVEIKAGDLRRYIKAVVDENDKLNFNLLMQGGPG